MEKKIKILVVLAVLSLVVNCYSILRLGIIKDNVTSKLNTSLNNEIKVLRRDINVLSRNINEIKQIDSWVIYKEFKPNKEVSSRSQIYLELEWSLKEIEKNANVYLLYRSKSKTEDWKKVTANSMGNNKFRASLVLSPEKNYEYKLISEGELVRTNNISEISSEIYKPASLEYAGGSNSSVDGKLINFKMEFAQKTVFFDFYQIKSISAKIYQDNDLEIITLEQEETLDEEEWVLDMSSIDLDKTITSVILEIEYKDGITEEKNITAKVLETMSIRRE